MLLFSSCFCRRSACRYCPLLCTSTSSPPKICLNYEHHETVTGNQEPERTWMIATLFAAMVFVNLVTIFKIYCNVTVFKGKCWKTLGYNFFSALNEIKGHYYIFSCFNVFFCNSFSRPSENKGNKCKGLGEKQFLSMSGLSRQCSGPSAVSCVCPMGSMAPAVKAAASRGWSWPQTVLPGPILDPFRA